MLFTVNKSPFSTNHLASALQIAPAGAPILLYEDGVYGVAEGAQGATLVQKALADHPVYALEADLEARGIRKVLGGVRVVNYDGFVELVEQHQVAPWL
jgi:tRNA 2-thiouridine synthesizing protein B